LSTHGSASPFSSDSGLDFADWLVATSDMSDLEQLLVSFDQDQWDWACEWAWAWAAAELVAFRGGYPGPPFPEDVIEWLRREGAAISDRDVLAAFKATDELALLDIGSLWYDATVWSHALADLRERLRRLGAELHIDLSQSSD
jgi:hypothetical protein